MALPPHLADLESRLASRFAEAVAEFRRAVEAQLRRDSDRWLSGIADIPAPAAGEWLAAGDLASLDLAPRQEASRAVFDRLAAALRALDLAASQAEALDALLDGALAWCDRTALVLARDQGLTGWGDRGFGDAGPAGREVEWDTTLRERLLASRGCLRVDAEAAGDALAQFGCEAAGDAVVVPLVLRDRIAALLWADRREGSPELVPLQILVHAAGQRLELQALSDRSFSPTLWEGAEAPGDPLPLWSVLTPAATEPAEPELAGEPDSGAETRAEPEEPGATAALDAESEELGAGMWQAEPPDSTFVETAEEAVAEAPAEDAELAAEAPAVPASFVDVGEDAAALGEVMPPDAAADEAPAEPEAEPQPAFEMESAAAVEEIEEAERWEPEPEPAEAVGADVEEGATTGAVEIPTEYETPQVDALGTVRMPLPALESFERPPEETTSPHPVVEAPAPEGAAGTQEVEAPPSVETDLSEDATQLSMRRPEIPEAPAAPPPPPPPAAEEHPMDRTGSRFGRSTEVAPPPDVSGPGLAFLAGRAGRASSDPAHDEAKRLARLLISEIRLYNEEQVLEGRRNRDLYHRLKEDIDRSRQIYEERVDAAVRGEVDYFQQELVRSLAGGDPRALGI